jgi:hypothetical protein
MTDALTIYAALSLIPFLLAGSAYHSHDSEWLELELERRIAEEDEAPAANDNRRLA